jgi:hypothetical protein
MKLRYIFLITLSIVFLLIYRSFSQEDWSIADTTVAEEVYDEALEELPYEMEEEIVAEDYYEDDFIDLYFECKRKNRTLLILSILFASASIILCIIVLINQRKIKNLLAD